MSDFTLPRSITARVNVDLPLLDTIEVPCPIPDCGSIVYTPGDSHNERIDCLDCGAALLTRRGIDGAVALVVTDAPVGPDDPEAPLPPPPLAAGPHVAAFDASTSKEEAHG